MASKNSKKKSKKIKKTAKRLAAYSAAAAATIVTTGDQSANAAEMVHDITDVTFTTGGLDFNLVTGGITSQTSYHFYYYGYANSATTSGAHPVHLARFASFYNPYFYQVNYDGFGAIAMGTETKDGFFRVAENIGHGAAIDTNRIFTASGTHNGNSYTRDYGSDGFKKLPHKNWGAKDEGHGFVGISFSISGQQHFGWAEVTRGYDPDGNFNLDDKVDGADFLEAQRGFGALEGDYTSEDLTLWEENFPANDITPGITLHGFGYQTDQGVASVTPTIGGSTIDPPAAVAAAGIPEPSSILLLAMGAAGLGSWRRRRSKD